MLCSPLSLSLNVASSWLAESSLLQAVIDAGHEFSYLSYLLFSRYNIMLKCWSEEPEQRPSFSALAKTFERMENDTAVSISIMMFFPPVSNWIRSPRGWFTQMCFQTIPFSYPCVFIFECIGFLNFFLLFLVDRR